MSKMARAPFDVRAARAGDAAGIARLSGELGYPVSADEMADRLTVLLRLAGHHVAVAESGVELLGFAAVEIRMLLVSGSKAELMGLVVGSDARRMGVGTALVRAAEEWCRAQGVDRMTVRSNTARKESHGFYERLGYTRAKSQHVYLKELAGG